MGPSWLNRERRISGSSWPMKGANIRQKSGRRKASAEQVIKGHPPCDAQAVFGGGEDPLSALPNLFVRLAQTLCSRYTYSPPAGHSGMASCGRSQLTSAAAGLNSCICRQRDIARRGRARRRRAASARCTRSQYNVVRMQLQSRV